jgi:hypothetical protein
MSTSQLQILANQANAQKSTGPRTDLGKKRASLNALRHGLTSQVVVLPGEDMQAYIAFGKDFAADLQPSGAVEIQLVQTLVSTQWRLNRFAAHETNLFAVGHEENASRFQTEDETIQTALSAAITLRENLDSIKTLSIHEQRLVRTFVNTMRMFQDLKAARLERESAELQAAIEVRRYCIANGLPFNPAEYGFVLTNDQIAIKSRILEAREAAKRDAQHSTHEAAG